MQYLPFNYPTVSCKVKQLKKKKQKKKAVVQELTPQHQWLQMIVHEFYQKCDSNAKERDAS